MSVLQWIRSLLFVTPPPPDVDILPWPALDLPSKDIIITFVFVIPSRIDVAHLQRALFKCIELKVPRAGARLAYRNGKYEYHIPRLFKENVPPAAFTSSHHSVPFADLDVPRPTGGIATCTPFVVDMPNIAHLVCGPHAPRKLTDLLRPNTPALHVHVCTLDDVTLLGITSSHSLFDIHGLRTLVSAWTASLSGTLDSVQAMPRLFSPLGDILASTPLTPLPKQEPVRHYYNPGLVSKARFIIGFVWKMMSSGPETRKLVCFPKTWLAEQKASCMDIASESNEYVGTADVLLAWWYKTLYSHRKDSTIVRIKTVVNLRRLLPRFFAMPYLNNAAAWCSVQPPIKANVLGAQPVAATALAIRRSINDYVVDLDTLRSEMAWTAQFAGVGNFVLPYLPGEEMVVVSNWRSAELQSLDFSAARADESTGHCRPVLTLSYTAEGGLPLSGVGSICCETDEALWLNFTLPDAEWRRLISNGTVTHV